MDFVRKKSGAILWIFTFFLVVTIPYQGIAGENLIKNSSFELGLSQAVSPAEFHLVDGDSYHGDKHAKFIHHVVYFPSRKLDLPGSYTFSVYIRSNPAGIRLQLYFLGEQWKKFPSSSTTVSVSDKWTRYSVTAELPAYTDSDGRSNIYRPTIYVIDRGKEVHIDAVQLEKSTLTAYSPTNEIEIGGWTEKYANVFIENEPLNFNVGISNYTNTTKSVELRTKATDVFGTTVLSQSSTKSLSPNQVVLMPLTIPTSKKGHFRIKVEAFEGNSLVKQHTIDIAKIASIRDTGSYHPNSTLGIDPYATDCEDPVIEEDRWRLLADSGVHWVKTFILWRYVESQEGTYDWSYYDNLVSRARSHKMKIIACFERKQKPSWATGEALEMKAYKEFCMAAINRYLDINVWELCNEIYGQYAWNDNTPTSGQQAIFDAYISFHKDLYSRIKAVDSTKKILMNAFRKTKTEGNLRFLEDSTAKSILDYCDGISGHVYPGEFVGKEVSSYDSIYAFVSNFLNSKNRSNMPIFQTEAGFSSDDIIDKENNLYSEYAQHMDPNSFAYGPETDIALLFLKSHILQMTKGTKVNVSFRLWSSTPYPSLFTMFHDSWEGPKIIYPTSNAMADIIDETQFVERIIISDKIMMPVFKGAANYIIPYWSIDNVTIPLSVGGLSAFSVKDMMGNNVAVTSQLPLSNFPNYLFVKLDELDKFKSGLGLGEKKQPAPSNFRLVVP